MKTRGGMEVQLHTFLISALDGGWVTNVMPRPLYSREKSLLYPRNRGLVGPHSRSGSGAEEKNSLTLSGIEPWSSIPWSSHCTYSYVWHFLRLKLTLVHEAACVHNDMSHTAQSESCMLVGTCAMCLKQGVTSHMWSILEWIHDIRQMDLERSMCHNETCVSHFAADTGFARCSPPN
jgi:hypothetical protein